MKVETRTEERLVTTEYKVFVAIDGKEFDSEKSCKKYEKELEVKRLEPMFEKLKIKELDGIHPITLWDSEWPEKDYWWCLLKSADDYKTVVDYYDALNISTEYISEPSKYPMMLCIAEEDDYIDTYDMDHLMAATKAFYKKFNINVNFKEEN